MFSFLIPASLTLLTKLYYGISRTTVTAGRPRCVICKGDDRHSNVNPVGHPQNFTRRFSPHNHMMCARWRWRSRALRHCVNQGMSKCWTVGGRRNKYRYRYRYRTSRRRGTCARESCGFRAHVVVNVRHSPLRQQLFGYARRPRDSPYPNVDVQQK